MEVQKVTSALEFEKFVERKMPVIFEGYAINWDAHKKWDMQFFKENLGDIKVDRMRSTSNIHPDFNSTKDWETYESSLKEYLQDVSSSNDTNELSYYFLAGDALKILCNYEYNPLLEALLRDFSLPGFYQKDTLKNIGLWISGRGPVSWLHFDKDHSDNFNVQVGGSKYFCLFDPKDAPNLYLKGMLESPYYNFSNIDIRNLDYAQMPNAKNVIKHEGVLNPADMLYIPADWLHSFKHLGDFNVNLTFWWMSDHQIYNKLKSREDYIVSLIKHFKIKAPDALLNSLEGNKIEVEDPTILRKLISYFEKDTDFEMFKQFESNIMSD